MRRYRHPKTRQESSYGDEYTRAKRRAVNLPSEYDDAPVNMPYKKVKRMLAALVGQPYGEVRQHILSKFHGNKRIQADYILNRYVEKNLCSKYWWGGKFFQDDDGILRRVFRKKHQQSKKKSPFIKYGGSSYYCYNNIWYEVLVKKPESTWYEPYDAFKNNSKELRIKVYGRNVYVASKRQIGKREKKKIGLR